MKIEGIVIFLYLVNTFHLKLTIRYNLPDKENESESWYRYLCTRDCWKDIKLGRGSLVNFFRTNTLRFRQSGHDHLPKFFLLRMSPSNTLQEFIKLCHSAWCHTERTPCVSEQFHKLIVLALRNVNQVIMDTLRVHC